jgi:hypothetical protein
MLEGNCGLEERQLVKSTVQSSQSILQGIHYLIRSIQTPTRNCNTTFPVTSFSVMDINTAWAHPLALWQLEFCQGDFLPGVRTSLAEWQPNSSCRAVARAVSDVGCWGLAWSQCSNSAHRCSMGFRSWLWAVQSISGTLLSTTIPSQTLLYGRKHCHADTDNHHHWTGLLP